MLDFWFYFHHFHIYFSKPAYLFFFTFPPFTYLSKSLTSFFFGILWSHLVYMATIALFFRSLYNCSPFHSQGIAFILHFMQQFNLSSSPYSLYPVSLASFPQCLLLYPGSCILIRASILNDSMQYTPGAGMNGSKDSQNIVFFEKEQLFCLQSLLLP
jgi:hypothetical protein